MTKFDKGKNVIKLLILFLTIILVIFSVSYAFYLAQITGSETSSTIYVTAGTMQIEVSGGNNIVANNIVPDNLPFAVKTFTITGTNTTSDTMNYTVYLVIDENTLSPGGITYTLSGTNTGANGTIIPDITNQEPLNTGTSEIVLGQGNFANGTSKVHTYTLNIYHPEYNIDQSYDQGKSFNAHIKVTGEAISRTITFNNAPTGTLLKAIYNDNTITTPLTMAGREISSAGEVVFSSTWDDYGVSYYFRGAIENNYVVFANMCWRIVRVTGNSAIKLVLYNYNPNTVVNPCDTSQDGTTNSFARYTGTTYTTAFNTNYNYNAYIGFMYGIAGSTTYDAEHANTNKSTILTNLETWYTSKLSSFASSLADTIWCNDKSIDTVYTYGTILGYGANQTAYASRGRIYANGNYATLASPTLICPNDSSGGKLSKFTVDDIAIGNGALTYKIGLLTSDEIAYAGGAYSRMNVTYYLYNNANIDWWSLSPSNFNGTRSYVGVGAEGGDIWYSGVGYTEGLRPAISLVPTITVTGSGTSSNPYLVQ